MTIVFPRPLPVLPVSGLDLDIVRNDLASQGNGARLGSVVAGFPVFGLTLTAAPKLERDSETWAAWIDAQEGSSRLFFARDLTRRLPFAYLGGLPGGWDGVCSAWSQAADGQGNAVMTLHGLPAGLILSVGDRIGLRWGDHSRALVKIVEGVVANGGGVGAVTIRPAVPSITPGDAVAYLAAPECLMRLDKGTSLGPMTAARVRAVKISAMQDLIA